MEEQVEIQRAFRQQQDRYTYYILALCVAAIGFSVHETSGEPLKWTQLPLGLAVASWGASIYCGLKFKQYVISTLFANNAYIDMVLGKNKTTKEYPEWIDAAKVKMEGIMKSNSNKGKQFANWMDRLFAIGAIAFMAWHILEMYYISL